LFYSTAYRLSVSHETEDIAGNTEVFYSSTGDQGVHWLAIAATAKSTPPIHLYYKSTANNE